jgi:hypothetical protein
MVQGSNCGKGEDSERREGQDLAGNYGVICSVFKRQGNHFVLLSLS